MACAAEMGLIFEPFRLSACCPVMDRVTEYLRRATEAEAKAASAPDPKSKSDFLKLADEWRNLAHQAGGPPPAARRT
jgi:hypothetical protein